MHMLLLWSSAVPLAGACAPSSCCPRTPIVRRKKRAVPALGPPCSPTPSAQAHTRARTTVGWGSWLDLHSPDRNRTSISDDEHEHKPPRGARISHSPLPRPPPTSAGLGSARRKLPLCRTRGHTDARSRNQMCHRQLRLWKATQCGHLTFSGETSIDCGAPDCFHSSAHPPDCGAPGSGSVCNCRRYYTCVRLSVAPCMHSRPAHSQPERILTHEVGTPPLAHDRLTEHSSGECQVSTLCFSFMTSSPRSAPARPARPARFRIYLYYHRTRTRICTS